MASCHGLGNTRRARGECQQCGVLGLANGNGIFLKPIQTPMRHRDEARADIEWKSAQGFVFDSQQVRFGASDKALGGKTVENDIEWRRRVDQHHCRINPKQSEQ